MMVLRFNSSRTGTWCAIGGHGRLRGRRREKRCRRGPWGRDVSSSALGASTRILTRCRGRSSGGSLSAATRLVPVVRVLALVALLFLFGQSLPLVLLVLGFLAPKLADDLGYLRIGEARVVHSDLALVVLTV